MSVPRPERRKRGFRSVGRLIAVLIVVTVGVFGVMAQLAISLYNRQNAVAWSVREDAMWAAFQADREAARMIDLVLAAQIAPTPDNIDAALLRYDLLYSRAMILEQDSFAIRFDDSGPLADVTQQARESIIGLERWIPYLSDGPASFLAHVGPFLDSARQTLDATGELVLVTNAALNDARVAERAEVAATNLRVIVCAALIASLFVAIVALQSVQVAQIRRSRREIVALSEHNALNAERAEAASRAKSMFLATMSHEIRTPLNGLIGTAELMADEPLSPTQADYLMTIRKSGEVLLDVITDILDFSKMEAGRMTTERNAFNLGDIIAEVAAVMGQRARQSGLTLRFDAPSLRLTTDAARVRQVLVNLVGNAIKFTPAGTVSVVVTRSGPDRILVDVRDTGVGISAEGIANLFKDFSQVDGSASRRFQGSGLGLAICKRIVNALGGEIGVQSIVGVGSRFWFDIPCGPIQELAEDGKGRHPAVSSDPVPNIRSSGEVLVVEDNEINRKVVSGLLDKLGVRHRTANDGLQAVRMVGERPFDLVFMDYQMPVMNGVDATREIRARGYDLPIVGLTANAFVEDRETCLSAGMNDFIAKPVTRAKLVEALSRLLPDAARAEPVATAGQVNPKDGMDTGAAVAADNVERMASIPPARDEAAVPTGGEEPSDLAEVDVPHVQALLDDLSLEVLTELFSSFRTDAVTLLDQLGSAEGDATAERADAVLHALKGASQTVGLFRLAMTIQDMRQGPPPDARQVSRLRAALDAGLAALSDVLGTLKAREAA